MTLPAAIRSSEVNPGKLPGLFRKQFELCRVAKGETIACITDLGTRREFIHSAFAAAESLGADIYELCVNSIAAESVVFVVEASVLNRMPPGTWK